MSVIKIKNENGEWQEIPYFAEPSGITKDDVQEMIDESIKGAIESEY
jgi:hypothetical protein